MTHIYLFNGKSSGSVYGIGTYIDQLKKSIVRLDNYILHIVCYKQKQEEFEIEELSDKLRILKIPISKKYVKDSIYMRNIWYLLQSVILFDENDRLIFHFNYYQEYLLVKLVKEKFPYAISVFTVHYQDWSLLLQGNISYLKKIISSDQCKANKEERNILKIFERDKELFDHVDYIITLSQFSRNNLVDIFETNPNKIFLIPNGIEDEGYYYDLIKKNKLRKKWMVPEEEIVILFVGRLEHLKGLDELIESFDRVLKHYPSSRLLIVGDGDFSYYISKCRSFFSKISFVGLISREELFEFYQIADIGVVPSKSEQFCYVAVEMMMFDLPLIISTTTALEEISEVAEKIRIVEKHTTVFLSQTELARIICNLIPEKRENIKIRSEFLKKYTIDIYNQRMREFYSFIC